MFTAIVEVTNNRVTKFSEFVLQDDADTHVLEHGGFVYEGNYRPDLWVVGETVTLEPVVLPIPDQINILKVQLSVLEKEKTSLRAVREILIQVLNFASPSLGYTVQQLAALPAYKGLKDLDDMAITIRAQIRTLEDQL